MAKNPEDLSSFKIADLKRPEVRSFTKPPSSTSSRAGASGTEASMSVGFPAIERRLETSTIEAVADELRPSYERLEALEGGQPKVKQAARKAMAAYERTADLFEYLFATKAAIDGSRANDGPGE